MNDTELIDYFKGLGIREILELARKSIQITAYNRELEHKIAELNDSLNQVHADNKILSEISSERKTKNKELKEALEELKTYRKIWNTPEIKIALTDIRTGERDLWQGYKAKLEEIKEIILHPKTGEAYDINKLLNTDDSELTESGKLAKQILTIIERKTDATN